MTKISIAAPTATGHEPACLPPVTDLPAAPEGQDAATIRQLRGDLDAANQRADDVTEAASRVLALVGHDLRQPLQTLVLLQGLLAKLVEGEKAQALVARLDASLVTLSDMLDAATNPTPPVTIARPVDSSDGGEPDQSAPVVCKAANPTIAASPPGSSPVILVVDDDQATCDAIREVLEEDGHVVEDFQSCEDFLASYQPGREGCLLVDAYLPGMSGLELLQRLHDQGDPLPAIMITGNSDVAMAVSAMKSGASDFIEKPVGRSDLLAGVGRALDRSHDGNLQLAWQIDASRHLAGLTQRQRQIMDMVLAGHPSKNIAADLGISQRTVENHRAAIMKRTGTKSLPALARLAVAAGNSAETSAPAAAIS